MTITLCSLMVDLFTTSTKKVFPVMHIHVKKIYLFHDGGRYHIETSPLICSANQWTGFYMITASVMKELTSRSEFSKTKMV